MKKLKNNYKKIIWNILGIGIFLWFAYWFIRVRILNDYGIVGNVLKLFIGGISLILYIIITIIYYIIKFIKNKRK